MRMTLPLKMLITMTMKVTDKNKKKDKKIVLY
jgi:hypothetical protein